MTHPSISVITACFNNKRTIANTIESVLDQTYPGIEYIMIDGGSTDGTTEIIRSYGSGISKFISEPDNGMYDAINKGIRIATCDIVGILNSDDFFYNKTVLEKIAESFKNECIDSVFGDVQFVDPADTSRIVRYYSSKNFNLSRFRFGYMPAHPSFYVKRIFFEKLGYYKTDYKIAADFELLVRFLLINKISFKYLEMPFVSMRTGGVSNKSIMSNFTLNREIARSCRENGISTNYFNIYLKYFTKISEFFRNQSIN
jgi:glycosyltransferase involved in cell wall biosynthesis